nr:diguanylate cyclase [Ardenticatena sp.]
MTAHDTKHVKTKVLILEDNPTHRKLLEWFLAQEPFEIFTTASAEEAWSILQTEQPRILIVDWLLEDGESGLEFVRAIRERALPYYTYIIMVTAKKSKEELIEGLESGADDFISKPFDADILLARIHIGQRIVELEESLRQNIAEMEHLAAYDMLTGFLNRRAAIERIDALLDHARRQQSPVGICMLDIDHFKQINDTFGHLAGDEALRVVTTRLRANVRPYDIIGRWGGEEFIVVLPDTPAEKVAEVATRLLKVVRDTPIPVSEKTSVPLTISIGALAIQHPQKTLDAYIALADAALYEAKAAGRNQVVMKRLDS